LDWMWSCDCVGYPSADQAPLLAELIRVLKPGGKLAILAWSSQQVLPGHPLLEARLNATSSSYLPYLKGVSRDRHFFRAPHWFRQAGLVAVKAYTFVGTVEAPFKAGERAALASLFEMLWGQSQPEAADEDWREYQRLCLPGSGDFILNLPDYYAFFTYSMFEGEKALAGA